MKQSLIPLCYYPTTVLVVDDSPDIIGSLPIAIGSAYPCETFLLPEKALAYLTERETNSFVDRCVEVDHEEGCIDESKLHTEVFNPDRFTDVGVLLLDYLMPTMNGLEFSQKVRNLNVGRIMLTGYADESTAIEAFNDQIIDGYVKKGSENMIAALLSKVHQLQWNRFVKLSEPVAGSIAVKDPNALSPCFRDQSFADWFQQFMKEHGIVEFYFISGPANFLMLDGKGHPSWLIVKDTEAMDNVIALAEDQHDGNTSPAADQLLQAITDKQRIPFFYSEADYHKGFDEWDAYCHPCKKLDGDYSDYYYAHVTDTELYDLDEDRIASFKDFLEAAIA